MAEYIYVAVDETGNLGKSLKGERYYTLVACVVNDRERFENATARLKKSEEVKFQTHEYLREVVLEYAAPAVSEVFFVRYHKDKIPLGRHEQPELHLKMIRSLADSIVLRYGYTNDLVVEVDHKDGIPDAMICRAFEYNEYRRKKVVCSVLDSTMSYGLQTNDFFVGAIGRMVNQKDLSYVRLFDSGPKECYIRNYNRKQGEPASATRNTGHTDNPFEMDSPPGIATEVLARGEGRPAVRLKLPSLRGYLRNHRRIK